MSNDKVNSMGEVVTRERDTVDS